MRSVFILFLSLAIFAPGVNAGPPVCQPTVDAFATANAPWKVGEQMRQYTIMLDTDPMHRDRFPSSYSNIVRRFQGMTPEGCFLVQDFYQQADASGRPIPYTSPVALTNAADAARVVFALSNAHVANGVEGSLNLWMPDGTPLLEGHYHDEQKTGHWCVWYSNGQKQTEGDFANDMALGTWMSWHPNGQKRLETNFENGQLHGRVTEWDDAGRKTRETVFDHGALVEETDFQP